MQLLCVGLACFTVGLSLGAYLMFKWFQLLEDIGYHTRTLT